MSNIDQDNSPASLHNPATPAIERIIHGGEKDLGGFSVRRVLPHAQQRMIGPWIFFDHMGPAEFQPGAGIDVRPHPHINLATVTYLFSGEIHHRDSLGSDQIIRPGDINLMLAGRGIVHSERTDPALRAEGHRLDGLQLWLALPEPDEEIEPAFYHYAADDIPATDIDGVPVRVMMGSAYGLTSPVRTLSPTLYLEAGLTAGQSLRLPNPVAERGLYLVEGELQIADTRLPRFSMSLLAASQEVTIQARQDSRIALIGGDPVGPRHIWWNFVSSRKQRIEQAKDDWRQGRFAKIAADAEEFIPLPEDD
mgnify:CR=1 FL=1